jgi:hypothetical protein
MCPTPPIEAVREWGKRINVQWNNVAMRSATSLVITPVAVWRGTELKDSQP